jgi:surface protein
MSRMFYEADVFNGKLDWNDNKLSKVTDMNHMFYDAPQFNRDITGWDVSSVTDMSNMFRIAIHLPIIYQDGLLDL